MKVKSTGAQIAAQFVLLLEGFDTLVVVYGLTAEPGGGGAADVLPLLLERGLSKETSVSFFFGLPRRRLSLK